MPDLTLTADQPTTEPVRTLEQLLLSMHLGGVVLGGTLNGVPIPPELLEQALTERHLTTHEDRVYLTPEGEGYLRAAYRLKRVKLPPSRAYPNLPNVTAGALHLMQQIEDGCHIRLFHTGGAVLERDNSRVRTLHREVVQRLRQRGVLTAQTSGGNHESCVLGLTPTGRRILYPKGKPM